LPERCRRGQVTSGGEVIFTTIEKFRLRTDLGEVAKKGVIEQAVRDRVDDAVESEGVVDIFTATGLPRADISVLDERSSRRSRTSRSRTSG
jgi:hypothetical protein